MPSTEPPDDPSVLDPPDKVRCFACGGRYTYLGRGVHSGRCPDCSARGVSPAGRLRVDETPAVVDGDALRVDATDATGRSFAYWVAALSDGVRAQLVRIRIEDTVVGPSHDAWPDGLDELVPDGVGSAVSAADLELVGPDPIGRN